MEKNLYEIDIVESLEFPLIVYSRDVNTMSDYIFEVGEKLQKKKYIGNVLFDLLLSNGLSDRYYSLIFNGASFEFSSLKKVEVSHELYCVSNLFYRNNVHLLKTSVLTKVQLSLFVKELRSLSQRRGFKSV